MILDLKPVKYNTNCFANNLIVQVCNYYSIDYLPFFLRYFNDHLYSEHLNKDFFNMDPTVSRVEKYPYENLIGFTYSEINNKNKFKEIIISQINSGVPVGMCIDGVDLQWSMSDRSVNRLILIIGYDEDKEVFIIADGYITNEFHELTEEEIHNGSCILLLNKKDDFFLGSDKILQAILYNYSKDELIKRNKDMNDYNTFIKFNFKKYALSLPYEDFMTIPFIYNLSHFVSNRNHFYKALKILCQNHSISTVISILPELFDIVSKWNLYKNLIIKLTLSQSESILIKACDLFENIIEMEASMIEKGFYVK